jgi:hypothetical protein
MSFIAPLSVSERSIPMGGFQGHHHAINSDI